jgi:hypothetical protein
VRAIRSSSGCLQVYWVRDLDIFGMKLCIIAFDFDGCTFGKFWNFLFLNIRTAQSLSVLIKPFTRTAGMAYSSSDCREGRRGFFAS